MLVDVTSLIVARLPLWSQVTLELERGGKVGLADECRL
jgi:hypothetical protein